MRKGYHSREGSKICRNRLIFGLGGIFSDPPFMLFFTNRAGIMSDQALNETAFGALLSILLPGLVGFRRHLRGNNGLGGTSLYAQGTIATEVLGERFIIRQDSASVTMQHHRTLGPSVGVIHSVCLLIHPSPARVAAALA